MIINIFLTTGLCLTAILGDFLVQKFENSHILKAMIDNGTHAAIGGLTWSIVCFQRKIFPSSSEIIWQVLLCTIVASLTDVDHFIEAKSLKLQDVHLLTNRPFMHCTTLAVGISLAFICLSYFYHWELLHSCGWIMFAAFISHHTRDATRRGYWVYPMGSTPPINYWVYISITAALPFIVANCFTITKPDKPIRKITNIEELYSLV